MKVSSSRLVLIVIIFFVFSDREFNPVGGDNARALNGSSSSEEEGGISTTWDDVMSCLSTEDASSTVVGALKLGLGTILDITRERKKKRKRKVLLGGEIERRGEVATTVKVGDCSEAADTVGREGGWS